MAAKFNSKGDRLISVVRVLEYHGTEAWIRKTMEASRIPIQGLKDIGDGCSIRSGLVQWEMEDVLPAERGSGIVIPPGTVQ